MIAVTILTIVAGLTREMCLAAATPTAAKLAKWLTFVVVPLTLVFAATALYRLVGMLD